VQLFPTANALSSSVVSEFETAAGYILVSQAIHP